MNADGSGQSVVVTTAAGGVGNSFSLSPDGSQLAWIVSNNIYVANADGFNPKRVATPSQGTTLQWTMIIRRRSGWATGFSIAETVIASFLLLLGFLVVARLFHSSLQYQVWVDSVNLATTTGEATLNSVRAWAQQPANFQNLEIEK